MNQDPNSNNKSDIQKADCSVSASKLDDIKQNKDYYNLIIYCSKDQHNHRIAHSFCTKEKCSYLPYCEECILKEHKNHIQNIILIADLIESSFSKRDDLAAVIQKISTSINEDSISLIFQKKKTKIITELDRLEDNLKSQLRSFIANNQKNEKEEIAIQKLHDLEATISYFNKIDTATSSDKFQYEIQKIYQAIEQEKLLQDISIKIDIFNKNSENLLDSLEQNCLKEIIAHISKINDLKDNPIKSLPSNLSSVWQHEEKKEIDVKTSVQEAAKETTNKFLKEKKAEPLFSDSASLFSNNLKPEFQPLMASPNLFLTSPNPFLASPNPLLASQKPNQVITSEQTQKKDLPSTIYNLIIHNEFSNSAVSFNHIESESGSWCHYFSQDILPSNCVISFEVMSMVYINYTCIYPQILFGVSETKKLGRNYLGFDSKSWSFGCTAPAHYNYPNHRCRVSNVNEQVCGKYHDGVFTSYGSWFRRSLIEMKILTKDGKRNMYFKVGNSDHGLCYDDISKDVYLALSMVGSCKIRLLKIEVL